MFFTSTHGLTSLQTLGRKLSDKRHLKGFDMNTNAQKERRNLFSGAGIRRLKGLNPGFEFNFALERNGTLLLSGKHEDKLMYKTLHTCKRNFHFLY